jgi:uncharacterized protein (DUF1697 family)
MNAKMPELKRCFEAAGFTNVRTLLSSGNVMFDAGGRSVSALQARAERAMQAGLGRSFMTIVRPVRQLQALVEADPFARYDLPPAAKRVVTFLRQPLAQPVALPLASRTARIHAMQGLEVFSSYVPDGGPPVFMTLIERHFGADVTTRTLDTVRKCASA